MLKSRETREVRIHRTGLKQWQKSAMLRKLIAKHGEPPLKWETLKRNYDRD